MSLVISVPSTKILDSTATHVLSFVCVLGKFKEAHAKTLAVSTGTKCSEDSRFPPLSSVLLPKYFPPI